MRPSTEERSRWNGMINMALLLQPLGKRLKIFLNEKLRTAKR